MPPAIVMLARDEAPKAEIWSIEQLRIDGTTEPDKVDKLAEAHSLKQAVAILNTLNVPFIHATATLRPDRLPPEIRVQIAALPAGEPFVLPDGKFISINVIVGHKSPPVPTAAPPPQAGAV